LRSCATSQVEDMKYRTLALAGTFDRLHYGHRVFISQAFRKSDKIIIGLTSDTFVQNKISNKRPRAKSYHDRENELIMFLEENDWKKRSRIVKIDDVYGPAIEGNGIEAILATQDSIAGARQVNEKRLELGLAPLSIEEVSLVKAEDGGTISSTRIRIGEINRYGKVLGDLDIFGKKMPENLRLKLKLPIGHLISNPEADILKAGKKLREQIDRTSPVLISAVGDEAVYVMNKLGLPYHLAIVDFHVKRVRRHQELADLAFGKGFFLSETGNKITRIANPAGHITQKLVKTISRNLRLSLSDGKLRVIEVEGEEDLAALPAVLLSPLTSLVFYGQPDRGVVAVETTLKKKEELLEMMNQ